jgi:hypothetical protein
MIEYLGQGNNNLQPSAVSFGPWDSWTTSPSAVDRGVGVSILSCQYVLWFFFLRSVEYIQAILKSLAVSWINLFTQAVRWGWRFSSPDGFSGVNCSLILLFSSIVRALSSPWWDEELKFRWRHHYSNTPSSSPLFFTRRMFRIIRNIRRVNNKGEVWYMVILRCDDSGVLL